MVTLQTLGGKLGKAINVLGRTLGNPLPEWNLSESLQSWGGAPKGSPFVWVKPTDTPPNEDVLSTQDYMQPSGKQSTGGGGGGQPADQISQIYQQAGSWEDQQRQQMIDMINQEYENVMGQLTAEEQALPGRYETFKQAVSANLAPVLTSLQEAQKEKLTGLEGEKAETKQQAALNLRQIHQLLSDLQQKQAGYLSSIGGWTSTAAPAMAEAFGRKAYESVSDLQRRRDLALADISRRITQTNEFYKQKVQDFENQKAAKLNLLEQDLQDSLKEIARQKGAAAEAKARATFDAWQGFLNSRRQIALEEAKWKESLALWKQQMDQQLGSAQQQLSSIAAAAANTYTNPLDVFSSLNQTETGTAGTEVPRTANQAMAPVQWTQPAKRAGETDDEYYARILGLPATQKETLPTRPSGIAGLYSWLI